MRVFHIKERIEFDQPIGTFQAIKHRCAQMWVEIESSRSILYWAAGLGSSKLQQPLLKGKVNNNVFQ